MRRLVLGLTIAIAAAFAAPAAHAASYCMTGATHSPCDFNPGTDLQAAIDLTEATAADDTIYLGATPYSSDSFAYTTGFSGNDLTIVGEGAEGPTVSTIQRASNADATTFVTASNGHVTFENLLINLKGAPDPTNTSHTGISVINGGATFDGVVVQANATEQRGANLIGVGGPTTLINSTVVGDEADSMTCIHISSSTSLDVIDSLVLDCALGVNKLGSSGSVDIMRSAFVGGVGNANAVLLQGGGTYSVDNVLMDRPDGHGLTVNPGGGQSLTGIVNQTTIVTPLRTALQIQSTNAGSTAQISVYDTISVGANTFSVQNGGNPVTVDGGYLYYDEDNAALPGVTDHYDSDVISAGFVSPTDFRLMPSSPLVDQDPFPLDGGESPFDLDGNPRISNGLRDLGAYEYQHPAPPAPGGGGGVAAVAPAISGSLKSVKAKRGKKAKLAYSLNAPVKVSFSAKPKKGKKPKSKSLGSQQGKAGKNTFSFKVKLKKGKYTLSATPAGGVAKTTTLTVK